MFISDLPIEMIKCLSITIIIELVFALILKVRDKKDMLNIVLVNILTNPLLVSITVWFNFEHGILGRNISLAVLEILVVIIEGFIYKKVLKFNRINPFLFALILNVISFVIGEVINYVF